MSVSAFLTGFFNKLNTANNLKTALSSRFYLGQAPQNTDGTTLYPYMVYHLIVNVPDWDMGTVTYEEYVVQCDLVSKSKSVSELSTLIGYLEALIDNATLTITGYTHIKTFREMSTIEYYPEDEVWVSNHRYRILIKKT
jgi:hypothetical protein